MSTSTPGPDTIATLDELTKGETWQEFRYRNHRTRSDGEHQDVEITLITRYDESGWMVIAVDHDRDLHASGNPHPDLDAALHLVHWFELDK